jgi:hypothetical protein
LIQEIIIDMTDSERSEDDEGPSLDGSPAGDCWLKAVDVMRLIHRARQTFSKPKKC